MVLTRLNTRRVRWVMWSVLAFGYLLMSFTRVSTAVLAESLTLAFNITATELGLLHSSFFYFYAAMQLPAGVLVDRYGPAPRRRDRHIRDGVRCRGVRNE